MTRLTPSISPTPPTFSSLLTQRSHLTSDLQNPNLHSGFSPRTYLDRASIHASLNYPDLAIGDAYRALLVIDEAFDECSQCHFKVVNEILRPFPKAKVEWEDLQRRAEHCSDIDEGSVNRLLGCETVEDGGAKALEIAGIEVDQERIRDFAHGKVRKLSLQAYQLLVDGLEKTGCLRTAYEYCQRGLKVFPEDAELQKKLKSIPKDFCATQKAKDPNFTMQDFDPKLDLPEYGFVRREIYPWNTHEPFRCNKAELESINARLKPVAPFCEVRAVELPILQPSSTRDHHRQTNTQLRLFATEDLPAGSTILRELSLITASLRAHDNLCDACTAPLPNILSSSPTASKSDGPFPCLSCSKDDILFCSDTCRALAHSTYHSTICGNPEYSLIAKDPDSPADAPNNLYFLLLARIFAISLTQSLHPLDLPEVRFLWGDFAPPTSSLTINNKTLPFSFKHNILYPAHLLTQLDRPDLPPWDTSRLDTWIVNTLYAKIRGVASARMGRDGKPEASAVHGLWCLANHSCAPNIWWEFGGTRADSGTKGKEEGETGGEMKMVVRKVRERVRSGVEGGGGGGANSDGEEEGSKRKNGKGWDGIRKGEQILNHYCDISLPVAARREWAKGALGGDCICERCVCEAAVANQGSREED